MPSLDPQLQSRIGAVAQTVEKYLDSLLPIPGENERRLFDAMRYSTLDGGKRLRAFLTISAGQMFNVAPECAYRAAATIEMVHSFALIHDDLPAMDDSDTRRGKPASHKQFDEATAILAGDGLLALAFEILADPATHEDPRVRIMLVETLARSSGPNGMAGGQMLDLIAETTPFDIGAITRLQRMKTGEMIAAACLFGAILGKANPPQRQALTNYAHALGLAFQIVDDLLDAEGDEETMGKPARKDAAANKATFVSILGVDRARQQAQILVDQAIGYLRIFDGRATDLEQIAQFVVTRSS